MPAWERHERCLTCVPAEETCVPENPCPLCESRTTEEWADVYQHWLAARDKLVASPPPAVPVGTSKSSLSRNRAAWERHQDRVDKLDLLVKVSTVIDNPCTFSQQETILSEPLAKTVSEVPSLVLVAAGHGVHRAEVPRVEVSSPTLIGSGTQCHLTPGLTFTPFGHVSLVESFPFSGLSRTGFRQPRLRGAGSYRVPGSGSRLPVPGAPAFRVPLSRVPGASIVRPVAGGGGPAFRLPLVPRPGFRLPPPERYRSRLPQAAALPL